ncbi:MAG: methyltransferase [Halieaceae bacterium]|nr:methyltransferase [Halieaceae bacterium]
MARYHDKVKPTEQIDPPLVSDQPDCHPDLTAVVQRHLSSRWLKPIPAHTQAAAEQLLDWLKERERPLVLDSFCGTGMSTAKLSAMYPDCAVVGVDKSAARLGRHHHQGHHQRPRDYLLLRAECEPLWRALVEAGITVRAHYLLYPNPWPKRGQLKRRIHGHPGLPWLLALGGTIELRTNWAIYAREFAQAMSIAGASGELSTVTGSDPITLFERKYHERGQTLWRWQGEAPLAQE